MVINLNKNRVELLITPIVSIIVGLLIIIFKGEVLRLAALSVGIIVVGLAIYQFILDLKYDNSKNIVVDIFLVLIGALIIVFAGAFATAIRIFSGIVLICYGAFKTVNDFDNLPTPVRCVLIVEAFLYLASGILLFLDKAVLYYILGSLLILNGAIDLVYSKEAAKLVDDDYKNKEDKHADAIEAEVKDK